MIALAAIDAAHGLCKSCDLKLLNTDHQPGSSALSGCLYNAVRMHWSDAASASDLWRQTRFVRLGRKSDRCGGQLHVDPRLCVSGTQGGHLCFKAFAIIGKWPVVRGLLGERSVHMNSNVHKSTT